MGDEFNVRDVPSLRLLIWVADLVLLEAHRRKRKGDGVRKTKFSKFREEMGENKRVSPSPPCVWRTLITDYARILFKLIW